MGEGHRGVKEMHTKRRENKERLDKENKQVRSISREESSKTTKQEAITVIKETKWGEGLWSLGCHAVFSHKREQEYSRQQSDTVIYRRKEENYTFVWQWALELHISGLDNVTMSYSNSHPSPL